ncbi:winged helix DNA-binding domain-containing protein [Brevibacillus migulae]|uniref:winged helix DNA-binding domain-containing protein n=1 Tax=Brevibacillus migulae TaxID=1644114 RepID=UPI00106E334C|nr:winged helix DNA-binding domain-containing protein [Brevibacillus migulae]
MVTAQSGGETVGILSPRALNRALLARQMLLRREKLSALEALERLVGLQAQAPNAPYFALWTRLEQFHQEELSRLIQERKAVRLAMMRSTIHLVSSRDSLQIRPWVQPVLERSLMGTYRKQLARLDGKAIADAGRALVEEKPHTFSQLGKRLSERYPDRDPSALSAAVRALVPLIQLPPRGLWGESGQAAHTSGEAWLGQPLVSHPPEDDIILRYLAAYGPATIKDIQVWSGHTRLQETMERIRPQLVTFRDEQGDELFDLPDAPRPDPDTPAQPRFLGEFDNILLSYANRTRIIDDAYRKRVITANGIVHSVIIIDGFVAGTWKIGRGKDTATLHIEPFQQISKQERKALLDEGARLLQFAAADARTHDISFVSPEE